MTRQWRLVRGEELYDIKADPGQKNEVAAVYPEVVQRLRDAHEGWWAEIAPQLDIYCPISLGNEAENPARLCAMDVLGDVAWHQTHITQAQKSTGTWAVDLEQPGTYRFSLRRWPADRDLAIDETIPSEEARQLVYASDDGTSTLVAPVQATIKLFGQEWQQTIVSGDKDVSFTVDVAQTGTTQLEAWFIDDQGDRRGAYYVDVERVRKLENVKSAILSSR